VKEEMSKQQIILIGGAPTAGKSKMAQLLSAHLDIPWISTDQIREIMRGVLKEDDCPVLFRNRNISGEDFLNKYSAKEIVNREIEEAEKTWEGVKSFIKNSYPWENFIVEGVAILPRLVARDLEGNLSIKPIFLVDENADRIREVVFTRGLWDDARTYPDEVKEKEVEWALLFSHGLRKEAERFGYPIIEVEKRKNDLIVVLNALNLE
jgi:2-phosphoglycerate kinase